MHQQKLCRNLVAALVVLSILPLTAAAEPTTWVVDPVHSNVGFKVRHLLTPVSGQFDDFSGTIVYDAEDPSSSSVEMVVQSASIDTDNERRDGHLRSADFFDVENHPTLSFQSKKVVKLGDNLAVTGDLTIRGVTREVTLPVQVLGVLGDKAGFATEFTIDRQDYGVSWNRALDQGGTILGDEVTVELSFEADRKVEDEPMVSGQESGR
jgi:polyisoprenoid-binding protein YceI